MHARTDAALALALAARAGSDSLVFVAHGEGQAARIAACLRVLAPEAAPVLLPAWDCLPFDQVGPSHGVMGRRMQALHRLATPGPHRLVASVDALAQRLPPPVAFRTLELATGATMSLAAWTERLEALGYVPADAAEQPGEFAVRAEVVDLFPAAAATPVRIRIAPEGGAARVLEIDRFDPASQRSRGAVERLLIGPASEIVLDAPAARAPGAEHGLPECYPSLVAPLELLAGATLLLDPQSDERMAALLEQVAEARATRVALCRAAGGTLPPDGLYITPQEWAATRDGAEVLAVAAFDPAPAAAAAADPLAACRAFVARERRARRRVGVSGRRLVRALGIDAATVAGWAGLMAAPAGSVMSLGPGLEAGFSAPGATVLADADVFGQAARATDPAKLLSVALRPGDAVIHLDHGIARLDGLETVQTGAPADCLVLGFAGGQRKLVACSEMQRVWRFGAAGSEVTLDHANGSTWPRRRATLEAAIAETARDLVARAEARRATPAPVLHAPRKAMARFEAGFGYPPTPDQQAAFDAVAADLARGWPMDRLVCGDVGYGKTEVALRAAAVAVLAGKQVAVLAPTTVLARQHLAVFARRFAAVGIEVGGLSRLTPPAEARRVRERLADGSLRLAVGTQALAGKAVRFADLGLVVIDEEQRFGTRDKSALSGLRDGAHVLAMTATPIPRTLEGSLAGLHDLSILATPPARRLPVRTTVQAFDPAVMQAALLREHARGGQSFVVCPRIEDLAALEAQLERLLPDLSVVLLHGQQKPDALDAALVGFAHGHGDVLLSTDIVEAGLDIPRANTMLVWQADRFGLAQLHQLRGRVGRGRARASVLLLTDPAAPPTEAGAQRLAALAAHGGLGAGFAIAAADLDQRGAGDLLGEAQSGHAKLLGVELARHLLGRALAEARGATVADDAPVELATDFPAFLPADYVPDPAQRLDLHARLVRPHDPTALAEEIEDRFGPAPEPVAHLLALAELREACRRAGVARLDAGPSAVAATLRDPDRAVPGSEKPGLEARGGRLLLRRETATPAQRIDAAWDLLHRLADEEPADAEGQAEAA